MVEIHRGKHSVKPVKVIDGITKMFPTQNKIELFARNNYVGWDNWGLEIPDEKIDIKTAEELEKELRESGDNVNKNTDNNPAEKEEYVQQELNLQQR